MSKILIPVVFILSFSSCTLLINPDPDSGVLETWRYFCQVIDTTYAGYKTKNLDWDSQKEIQMIEIQNRPTSEQLLDEIKNVFSFFNDSHLSIFTEDEFYYDYEVIYTYFSKDLVADNYLKKGYTLNTANDLMYGQLNIETCYIYMGSFPDSFAWIDLFTNCILQNLDKQYLVIDLRDNCGGSAEKCIEMIKYFIDKKEEIYTSYTKNGPGKNDYLIKSRVVEPVVNGYKKQVIILINKKSTSAADLLSILFKEMTNAVLIGEDNRAELTGNIIPRELPNKWIVMVPSLNVSINNNLGGYTDGDIIKVDIEVNNTKEGLNKNIDHQLEKALQWIEEH